MIGEYHLKLEAQTLKTDNHEIHDSCQNRNTTSISDQRILAQKDAENNLLRLS